MLSQYASGPSLTIGDAFVRHLSFFGELSQHDRTALLALTGTERTLERGEDLLRVGDRPTYSVVVLSGMLRRYTMTAAGNRQVDAFYLATDTPSLETLHIDVVDNYLGAVCPSRVGMVPHRDLFDLMRYSENLTGLFWRETLVQAAAMREWLSRNSQMLAHAQMAHLFCEMMLRSKAAGLSDGQSCEFPVTQEDLAEALGMSNVHVNRTLMMLRGTGLVEHERKVLTIPDFDRLADVGGFDPRYLHLHRVVPT